ncbi:NUDIX hydrolase [Amycolatopsis thermoflava]|uniref:NUDIX hydrolase n=1 Tax=Amycolatopsis thermoflava TaxID=84480 RepID=UPI0038122045
MPDLVVWKGGKMVEKPDLNEKGVARERKEHGRRNVAVVGLRNADDQILMIRTNRLPSRWQPIGGGVESSDKSPADALIREVFEELSISLDPSDLKAVLQAPYDFGEGTVFFYEAFFDPRVHRIKIDTEEIAESRWFDLSEAMRLPVFPATKTFLKILSR